MILALLLLAIGILLSAFFSGTETGFYRATRVRLALDALAGSWTSRAMLWLINLPSLFVATVLVGNNLANYVCSWSVVMGSQQLFPRGGMVVDLLAPILIAPLLFVCGELLPKSLFYDAPNRLLRRTAIPLLVCTCLFAPITFVLWIFSRMLQLLSRTSPQALQLTLARRELAELLTEGHQAGILRPVQQTLAQAMLEVASHPVRHFASPSGRVVRATTTMSKSDVLRLAQRHRRTLLPLEETRGKRHLVGFLRMVDLAISKSSALPDPEPLVLLQADESCLSALRKLSQVEDALGQVVSKEGLTIGFVTSHELRMSFLRAQ